MLTFRITNQKIAVSGDEPVAESVKYLKAQFYFSGDWSDVNRYALFYVIGAENPVQVNINNGVCLVPAESIRAPYMEVSVYGSNRDGLTITTEKLRIPVKPSGLAEGNPPLEPPRNMYEEVIDAVNTILGAEEIVIAARDNALSDIDTSENDAIAAIQAAEGDALRTIGGAGYYDMLTTFPDDTIVEETSQGVTTTVFNEDGSITETMIEVTGRIRSKTTRFLEDGSIQVGDVVDSYEELKITNDDIDALLSE